MPQMKDPTAIAKVEFGMSQYSTSAHSINVTNRLCKANTSAVVLYCHISGEKEHVRPIDTATPILESRYRFLALPSRFVSLYTTRESSPDDMDPKTQDKIFTK